MEIKTNNSSYKNRNRNKIATLIGNDQIYKDLLDFEFELEDGTPITMKALLERSFDNENRIIELNAKNEELKTKLSELKQELKKYIGQENEIDKALTNAVDLISIKLAQCETSISELKDKTRYL